MKGDIKHYPSYPLLGRSCTSNHRAYNLPFYHSYKQDMLPQTGELSKHHAFLTSSQPTHLFPNPKNQHIPAGNHPTLIPIRIAGSD